MRHFGAVDAGATKQPPVHKFRWYGVFLRGRGKGGALLCKTRSVYLWKRFTESISYGTEQIDECCVGRDWRTGGLDGRLGEHHSRVVMCHTQNILEWVRKRWNGMVWQLDTIHKSLTVYV